MTACVSFAPSFKPTAARTDAQARRRPQARTWRNLGLTLVVAAAAFWAASATNAPRIAAADPGEAFSIGSLSVPADLPIGDYAAH